MAGITGNPKNKFIHLLVTRGKATRAEAEVIIDASDNSPFEQSNSVEGVKIVASKWNVTDWGPEPTEAEMNALDANQAFIDFETEVSDEAAIPNQALADLKGEALMKTFLKENRATTLARGDAQKLNICILLVKQIARYLLSKHIKNMTT